MKKSIALALILSLLLSLAACVKSETPVPSETAPLQTTTPTLETVPAKYPMEVTDQAGRQITIPKDPQRIVSGYYISTSTLLALGLEERIVGIEAKAGSRAIYKLSAPRLLELPNVGTAKEFDLEGCISLNPDLVILPLKLKNAAESLAALEIPVLLVNPESRQQLLSMVDLISDATDTGDRAETLKTFLSSQETSLSHISGNIPTVYLAGNSAVLSTAGGAMYQSDMIALAGGTNVAQELTDSSWAEISYEQLLVWDPEYIILASDASYSVEDVLADPNLASCRAVQSGNVVHLPNQVEPWDSPIPGGILGSLWLASVLHEDQQSWESTNAAITDFYEQFYGFTYKAE